MATLSAKELDALSDELSCEQILIKKYKSYAQMTQDPQLKTACEQMASQHQNHYNTLMGHLN